MKFVSPALKHIVYPLLSRTGYLRRASRFGPVVVTYHGVVPAGYKVRTPGLDGNLVTSSALREHMRLLKSRYNIITPEEFSAWLKDKISIPPHSVLLTCDDALRNNLTEMAPVLHEFGVSCLFFATGRSVDDEPSMLWHEELYLMILDAGAPITISLSEARFELGETTRDQRHTFWWTLVEQLSPLADSVRRPLIDDIRRQLRLSRGWKEQILKEPGVADRFLVLGPAGLRKLVDAGMTIGAHSLSHPVLSRTSGELAWREMAESPKLIERAAGQPVWALAYPFGNAATVTTRDLRLAERAGFLCAFMNTEGQSCASADRFALPRVHITAGMELYEFEAHISGLPLSWRDKFAMGDRLRES